MLESSVRMHSHLQEGLHVAHAQVRDILLRQLNYHSSATPLHMCRFQASMQIFVKAVCGDVVACVWTATGQSMAGTSSSHPITLFTTQVSSGPASTGLNDRSEHRLFLVCACTRLLLLGTAEHILFWCNESAANDGCSQSRQCS